MTDEQSREAFEKWCRSEQHFDPKGEWTIDSQTGQGFYMDPSTDMAYLAWRAATARIAELENCLRAILVLNRDSRNSAFINEICRDGRTDIKTKEAADESA